MPDPNPRKNQKQIAQRYAGNRRYFWPTHGFRLARFVLALGVLLVAAVLGLIYLKSSKPVAPPEGNDQISQANKPTPSSFLEVFNTSGPLSQAHSKYAKTCEVCHDPAVKPNLVAPAVLNASLDAKCEVCHVQHTFHQASVVDKVDDVTVDRSCASCHHEHVTAGPMQPVADLDCAACHGNSAIMQASIQKAALLPASDFVFQPEDKSLKYYPEKRPGTGYTTVFQSFEDTGHPDFTLPRVDEHYHNSLKFSHQYHLQLAGLTCAECHKPDSRGAYMQPINFANNCASCHKLQIDPTAPDFQIPHPTGESTANSVRDFLLDLPTEYRSYAITTLGLKDQAVDDYVNKHMAVIRQRTREGADLATEVFQSDPKKVDFGFAQGKIGSPQALFQGCILCHEVKTLAPPKTQVENNQVQLLAAGEYQVPAPQSPDRWYIHAKFDHSAHTTVSCEECHAPSAGSLLFSKTGPNPNVTMSQDASDIDIPSKASCVVCHSAKGGVVSTCVTCHDYHNKEAAHEVATASSLRQMMLGQP